MKQRDVDSPEQRSLRFLHVGHPPRECFTRRPADSMTLTDDSYDVECSCPDKKVSLSPYHSIEKVLDT